MNLFKPIEHTEKYQTRKPNDKIFLFETEDKKYIYVGEKLVTFQTNDKIVNYFSDIGFNDIKCQIAYSEENIYFVLHRKYIPTEESKNSTQKDEYHFL